MSLEAVAAVAGIVGTVLALCGALYACLRWCGGRPRRLLRRAYRSAIASTGRNHPAFRSALVQLLADPDFWRVVSDAGVRRDAEERAAFLRLLELTPEADPAAVVAVTHALYCEVVLHVEDEPRLAGRFGPWLSEPALLPPPDQLALAPPVAPETPGVALFDRRPPSHVPPTDAYPELAAKLREAVARQDTNVVVIVGPSGSGKSRVAASLFEGDRVGEYVPVWYTGASARAEQFGQAMGEFARAYGEAKLCIVLDEDHAAARTEPLLREWFGGGAWAALRHRHKLVLTVWPGTAQALKDHLAGSWTIRMDEAPDPLGRDTWGLGRPLTEAEKTRIRAIASDGETLNLLFVEWGCIPAIRDRTLFDADLSPARSLLDRVYSRLIATRTAEERQILEALVTASRYALVTPTWLVAALTASHGAPLPPSAVDPVLRRLLADRVVAVATDPTGGHYPVRGWRLLHDLLVRATAEARVARGEPPIDETEVMARAASLLSAGGRAASREAWLEALAVWWALAGISASGAAELVAPLLTRARKHVTDPEQRPLVVRDLAIAVRQVVKARRLRDWPEGTRAYAALDDLARFVAENADDVCWDDLLEKQRDMWGLVHALSFVHSLESGSAVPLVQEVAQSRMGTIHRLGTRLASSPWTEVFEHVTDFTARVRYTQLLCWAQAWESAARCCETAVRGALESEVEDHRLALPRIHLAASAYVQAGLPEAAAAAYESGAAAARERPGSGPLAEQFAQFAAMLAAGVGRAALDWDALAARIGGPAPDWEATTRVAVVAGYENLGAASTVADELGGLGLPCHLVLAPVLCSWDDLVGCGGAVLLGSAGSVEVMRLALPAVGRHAYSEALMRQETEAMFLPAEVGGQGMPAMCILAAYPWSLLPAVDRWVREEGARSLAKRVRDRYEQG